MLYSITSEKQYFLFSKQIALQSTMTRFELLKTRQFKTPERRGVIQGFTFTKIYEKLKVKGQIGCRSS